MESSHLQKKKRKRRNNKSSRNHKDGVAGKQKGGKGSYMGSFRKRIGIMNEKKQNANEEL